MDSHTQAQLAAITEVFDTAHKLGAQIWLRGGWAMDFYLGRLTQDHEDVDWFTWEEDLPLMPERLASHGWTDLAIHPPEQQRDLVHDDVELGFAPLARVGSGGVVVAGGPYQGEPWPEGMVEPVVIGELEGIRCPIISPAAQIEIKRMMPAWAPGFRRRATDNRDIEQLEAVFYQS